MNHVIIVEGPDNIGKTTLVDQIALSLQFSQEYEIHKPSKNKITHSDGYAEHKVRGHKFVNYVKNVNYHKNNYLMLCDRSFLDELVYSKYRNVPYKIDYLEDAYVEIKKLKNIRFLFISLYGDAQTIEKFHLKAKDDEQKRHQTSLMMQEISTAFFNAVSNVPFGKKLLINSNNYESLQDRNDVILEYVRNFVANRVFSLPNPDDNYYFTIFNQHQNIYSNDNGLLYEPNKECKARSHADKELCKALSDVRQPDIVGNLDEPSYLFVGEVPGYKDLTATARLPWYRGPAAMFFQSMLYELEIPQTKCLMTNTVLCPQFGNSLQKYYSLIHRKKLFCVSELLNKLLYRVTIKNPECKIVALGKTASSTLHMLGFKNIIETNHPAWFLSTGKRDTYFQYMRKRL